MVIGSSDNIGVGPEIDTCFFDKSMEILQKSWQQIVQQAWSAINEEINLRKS